MLETKKKIGRIMLITAAIYLLSSLSCATSYGPTCLICRILQIIYIICGILIAPQFIISLITAIISTIIYHKTSEKENKRKKEYAKMGVIISTIILILLILLIIALAAIPYIIEAMGDIYIPKATEALGGCKQSCKLVVRPGID